MKRKMTPDQALAALEAMTETSFPTAESADSFDETRYDGFVEAGREAYAKATGRPSLTAPGARSPQITLRLPGQMDAQLNELAARTGRRRSEIVRDALGQYLATAG